MTNTELSNIADNLISSQVYCSQDYLVRACLEAQTFSYDDIDNFFAKDDEEQEILEWVCVSKWLAEKIKEQGEPVLSNEFGNWWGRTTFGQRYSCDGVILSIARQTKE